MCFIIIILKLSCSPWQLFPKYFFICVTKLLPTQHRTTLLSKPEKPMAKLGTVSFPLCPSIRSGHVLTASRDLTYVFSLPLHASWLPSKGSWGAWTGRSSRPLQEVGPSEKEQGDCTCETRSTIELPCVGKNQHPNSTGMCPRQVCFHYYNLKTSMKTSIYR